MFQTNNFYLWISSKLAGGACLRAIAITGDYKTGATEPTAPGTLRGTVVDNNVTWELFGGHLHDGKAMDGSAPKVAAGEVIGGLLPIGSIIAFAGTAAPDNFLLCDGSTFNATTYADLNTLLGGNTLPDLRGQFLVGYKSTDTDYNAIFKTGGEKVHQLSEAEMPTHHHTLPTNDGSGSGSAAPVYTGTAVGTVNSGDDGSNTAHENRPPFSAVNYIIKAL